jgi:hypothetical protein
MFEAKPGFDQRPPLGALARPTPLKREKTFSVLQNSLYTWYTVWAWCLRANAKEVWANSHPMNAEEALPAADLAPYPVLSPTSLARATPAMEVHECPICSNAIPVHQLEAHVELCLSGTSTSETEPMVEQSDDAAEVFTSIESCTNEMRDTICENGRFFSEPNAWPAKDQAVRAVEVNLQRALTMLLSTNNHAAQGIVHDNQSEEKCEENEEPSEFAGRMHVDVEIGRKSVTDDEEIARQLQLKFEEEEKQHEARLAEEAATHRAFVHEQTHCALCDKQHQVAEMCFLERCSHCVCRGCLRNYIIPKVEAKCCLEHQVLCPLAQCQIGLTSLDIKGALQQQEYEAYLNVNLQLVIDSDAKFVRCPHEGCGVVIERVSAINGTIRGGLMSSPRAPLRMDRDPPQHLQLIHAQSTHQLSMSPMVIRSPGAAAAAARQQGPEAIDVDREDADAVMVEGADDDVQFVDVMSESSVISRHKQEYRLRCPKGHIFCASCYAEPYHEGRTCVQWRVYSEARKCRYCGDALPLMPLMPATTLRHPLEGAEQAAGLVPSASAPEAVGAAAGVAAGVAEAEDDAADALAVAGGAAGAEADVDDAEGPRENFSWLDQINMQMQVQQGKPVVKKAKRPAARARKGFKRKFVQFKQEPAAAAGGRGAVAGAVAGSASMFALGRARGGFGFPWRGRRPPPALLPEQAAAAAAAHPAAAAGGGEGGIKFERRAPFVGGDRPPLGDVCTKGECVAKERLACGKQHRCGHACGGVRGESRCLPCLQTGCSGEPQQKQEKQRERQRLQPHPPAQLQQQHTADDFCNICWVEDLGSAPSVQVRALDTRVR